MGFYSSKRQRGFTHASSPTDRFHVHITHVRVSEGAGAFVGQAHLVEDVIENLAIDSEYYTKRTLIFGLGVETDLYAKFAASGSKFLNGHDE